MYNFVFYNYTLWKYDGLVNHTFTTILFDAIIFPSTTILYLSHFPQRMWKAILHVLMWVSLFAFWELISDKLGFFNYEHGWNLLRSVGFDILLFTLIRFHYKKPLLAWPISFVIFGIFMYIIKIPFSSIK
jgi:hypothetical protein